MGPGPVRLLALSVQVHPSVLPDSSGLGECLPQQTGPWLLYACAIFSPCKPESVPSISRGTGWAHLRETHNEGTDRVEGQRKQWLEGY